MVTHGGPLAESNISRHPGSWCCLPLKTRSHRINGAPRRREASVMSIWSGWMSIAQDLLRLHTSCVELKSVVRVRVCGLLNPAPTSGAGTPVIPITKYL